MHFPYELHHYSAEKHLTIENFSFHTSLIPQKPSGMWLSVYGEDDWLNWCIDNEFAIQRLLNRYKVKLKPDAELLWLQTPVQILEFTEHYLKENIYNVKEYETQRDLFENTERKFFDKFNWNPFNAFDKEINDLKFQGCGYLDGIDWARVAIDYPGIVIAPYQWCLRMDRRCHWYYTWDCASGCIWDADCIESFESDSEYEPPKIKEKTDETME